MRILLVSHLFPNAADARRGLFVCRQAEFLRREGCEIEVISPVPYIPGVLTHVPRWRKYRHQTRPFECSGFNVHRPGYIRPPGAWFIAYEGRAMWRGMRATVRRLAARKPFELVYAQDFMGCVGAGCRAGRDLGIPCVGMAIGGDLNMNVHVSGGARRAITQALLDCDGVVCNSQALCRRADDLTRGRCKSEYITRGTDTKRFTPATDPASVEAIRRELGWPREALVLIYVGYLLRRKGIFELVEAFDQVAARHPDALLILVGAGPARVEFEARTARSPFRDRIRLLGHVEPDELPKYYRAADVLVLPSHHEGMPNVVVEASASGLPILATNVGGIPEAVPDERYGLLVCPDNSEELGRAMDRLLGDVALRTAMGRACRERAVEHFDMGRTSRRLREFLEETARNGRRPPNRPVKSLAMMVDITSNAPPYNEALGKSMLHDLEVTCRASPPHRHPNWYDESGVCDDLMVWAVRLGRRYPGLREKRFVWQLLSTVGYVSAWMQVIAEMVRRRTPVLHVQWCKIPLFDVWVFLLLHMLRVKIVYTVHNVLPHGDRRWFSKWEKRQLYRLADALVVLSKQVGRDVEDRVLAGVSGKIHLIEHGLLYPKTPSPTRAEARQKLGLDERAGMLLFFGGIEEYKGIADLIDAFAIAARRRPELLLYIAGNPWEPWEPYQRRIDRLGIADRVEAFARYVSEQDKVVLYSAADISMLPHRDPSQSAMGLESLALGKPLIATRAGGLPDLVEHGKTGYLVPVRDPRAMAEAILAFFEQSLEQRQAMAEASRQLGLQRFDWKVIGRKHLELYRSLAGV